jgi:hypothetical protein
VLGTALLFAYGAPGQEPDADAGASDFSRPGLYVGVGGTYALPTGWDKDFDNDPNSESSDRANATAQAALDALPPPRPAEFVPLSVVVDGADLQEGFLGVDGLVGYRVADLLALEIEGEWLFGSNETDLDVSGSTGIHRAEIEDIWALTGNVKVLPLGGRFQPFAVFGLGVQHSSLDVEIQTAGLTTTTVPTAQNPVPLVLPGDFVLRSRDTSLDGVLRIGIGFDVYATENVAAEVKAGYVLPFSEVGDLLTDYFAIRWGLIYRF